MNDDERMDEVGDEGSMTRRAFVRQTTLATGTVLIGLPSVLGIAMQGAVSRNAIVSALGDTLIPSAPGDPGYKDLEPHGITEEVLKGLSALTDEVLQTFNQGSAKLFPGKSFIDLAASQRSDYLKAIVAGKPLEGDPPVLAQARSVYRAVRLRVLIVYYQNFPENKVPKDKTGIPLPGVRDSHDIINPNTKKLVTGWDVANYPGPVRWEEEEQLRARMKKISWEGE